MAIGGASAKCEFDLWAHFPYSICSFMSSLDVCGGAKSIRAGPSRVEPSQAQPSQAQPAELSRVEASRAELGTGSLPNTPRSLMAPKGCRRICIIFMIIIMFYLVI